MRVSVTAYLKDEAKEIFYLVFNGMGQPKQKHSETCFMNHSKPFSFSSKSNTKYEFSCLLKQAFTTVICNCCKVPNWINYACCACVFS